ncbi:MAG: hypothetical protein ACRCU6_08395 [Fusobacteriaceae bacterium]
MQSGTILYTKAKPISYTGFIQVEKALKEMVIIEIKDLVGAKKFFSQYIIDQEYLSHSKNWCILVQNSKIANLIYKYDENRKIFNTGF